MWYFSEHQAQFPSKGFTKAKSLHTQYTKLRQSLGGGWPAQTGKPGYEPKLVAKCFSNILKERYVVIIIVMLIYMLCQHQCDTPLFML